jgi:DNA-directed RNA polymerase subunit alpha
LNIIQDSGKMYLMQNPNFSIKEEKVSPAYSEFTIEPLPSGYGHTMGNALRRTLLTSIEGAAVTSVKISGVKHKFSTVAGLKENIVDLLLNIKGLNFRLLDSKDSSFISLAAKGPKELLASDLELPDDVEVINKDHYIGFLSDKKAKLDMELTIEKGLGYSLAEDNKVSTLGVIPTDAIFTPVKRVSYDVFATRVGRQTDLDKLILKVWTNGIVSPKEALDEAARIISSYFLQIYEPRTMISQESTSANPSISDATLNLTIDEVDLPTRIFNSLRNGGIETIGQLIKTSKKDLLSMRNLGRKSIEVIEGKLKEKDISLME